MTIRPTEMRAAMLARLVGGGVNARQLSAPEKNAVKEMVSVGYARLAEGIYEATLDGRMAAADSRWRVK